MKLGPNCTENLWSIARAIPWSPHGRYHVLLSPWKFHGAWDQDQDQ